MPRTREKAVFLFKTDEMLDFSLLSEAPLWKQLESALHVRIRERCALGSLLPGELELVERFGLSRDTVRKAYASLIRRGVIERRAGIGTRVISTALTEDLGRMKSFFEEMQLKGKKVLTELLGVTCHQPTALIANQLALKRRERTLLIRRLQGHKQCFPLVYLTSELPESLGIAPDEDFSTTLYHILETKYGLQISHGVESICAGKATDEEATLLKIPVGETVLIVERLTYQRGSTQPIEFVRGVYRYDQYVYSRTMRR